MRAVNLELATHNDHLAVMAVLGTGGVGGNEATVSQPLKE